MKERPSRSAVAFTLLLCGAAAFARDACERRRELRVRAAEEIGWGFWRLNVATRIQVMPMRKSYAMRQLLRR